jgi:hypothetical protein
MIKFNKPVNLNGTELLAELNAGKVKITEPPLIDGNGDFLLDIDAKDEAKAKPIVAAHNGTTVAPDKSAAKAAILDRIGLTADELKTILG